MECIVAIDVGIKNLGICVLRISTGKVCHWASEALVDGGRYTPSRNVEYVVAFVQKHRQHFEHAKCVLVERQMRVNMRIIEAAVQALHYDRCIVVSPRLVKMHFGLSRNNYRLNKQAAVQWMQEFVVSVPELFEPGLVDSALASTKQDDLADALLMVVYYADTYTTAPNVRVAVQ
eukprot:scaffold15944_cov115-Isochrysis_galbana.AAC.12